MAVTEGSCRFQLWHVRVQWSGTTVYRLQFARTGTDGPVPLPIRQYCSGRPVDLTVFSSPALGYGGAYGRIYEAVRAIPYGDTATYGEIARIATTTPRVVGQAMAHNPTPLVIPCHRVVGARGIGGFTPSVEIKAALLSMERKRRE